MEPVRFQSGDNRAPIACDSAPCGRCGPGRSSSWCPSTPPPGRLLQRRLPEGPSVGSSAWVRWCGVGLLFTHLRLAATCPASCPQFVSYAAADAVTMGFGAAGPLTRSQPFASSAGEDLIQAPVLPEGRPPQVVIRSLVPVGRVEASPVVLERACGRGDAVTLTVDADAMAA